MNISDPIADMLTRVRNASRARHTQVVVPASRTKREIAARVRATRKPEPYKGKGVRYAGEQIRRKAGKAGKIGGKK